MQYHHTTIDSQIKQFTLDLNSFEVEIQSLQKHMGASTTKQGIFNVKTVVTENGDEEPSDLQESRVIESSFTTRLNFFKQRHPGNSLPKGF